MADDSPLESIFTFDSIAMTLKTYTSDNALASTKSLKLGVKFTGVEFTTYEGFYTFDVQLIDICSNGATITSNP